MAAWLSVTGLCDKTCAAEAKKPAWTLESRQCLFPGVDDQDYVARGSLTRHNDTWVFIYSHGSTHQHRPPHVIPIHFSEDEGRTWSEADKLPDGTAVKGAPFKPKDPTNELSEGIILTCPNNDLLVQGRENTDRVFHGVLQFRSRDGGRTWQEEESLVLKKPGMHGALDWVVVGKTIYLPLMIHETSSTRSPLTVELYKSTDNGKSWQHVARIGETAEEVNETGIEYLGGTTLVTVHRTRLEHNTLLRRSDDMGKTWQPLVDIGKDVGAVQQPKLRRFADEPSRLYLFGRDRIEEYVQRNSVWYSDDRGNTWTSIPLDETMFRDTGYGEALKRKDGSLYCLSYRGSDAKADMWEYVLRPTVQGR